MSYQYQKERPYVFSEAGQKQFLSIRDRVGRLLKEAGAFRLDAALAHETGSWWEMTACVDRLVELGEITEITGPAIVGQHRVFVRARE